MIEIYYYLVLINAALFLGVAAITYWRNRFHQAGVYGALALAATGVWLVGFAQYYRPWPVPTALVWAKFTLTLGVLATPLVIQFLFALAERRGRWQHAMVGACYLTGLACVWLLWTDQLLTGCGRRPTSTITCATTAPGILS